MIKYFILFIVFVGTQAWYTTIIESGSTIVKTLPRSTKIATQTTKTITPTSTISSCPTIYTTPTTDFYFNIDHESCINDTCGFDMELNKCYNTYLEGNIYGGCVSNVDSIYLEFYLDTKCTVLNYDLGNAFSGISGNCTCWGDTNSLSFKVLQHIDTPLP